MSEVTAEYEAYPYPERDPQDERTRRFSSSESDRKCGESR